MSKKNFAKQIAESKTLIGGYISFLQGMIKMLPPPTKEEGSSIIDGLERQLNESIRDLRISYRFLDLFGEKRSKEDIIIVLRNSLKKAKQTSNKALPYCAGN